MKIDSMRWIVGLLLVAAALLKGLDLTLHPALLLVDRYSRILLPILIGSELGLGLAAIANLFWNRLRLLAIWLFASFASYSLWLALHGAISCGCFGPLEIHPWWTFLIDCIVLLGLILEYYTMRQDNETIVYSGRSRTPTLIGGIVVISSLFTGGLALQVAPRQASSPDDFQTVGDLTILEPETWVGQNFPLLGYLNIDVSQGEWVLLLHHHDCPKCQEAVPKYEKLAFRDKHYQVAIIEVPPYDNFREAELNNCFFGRLKNDREWLCRKPQQAQES